MRKYLYAFAAIVSVVLVWLSSKLLFGYRESVYFPKPPLYRLHLAVMLPAVVGAAFWCGVAAIKSFRGRRLSGETVAPLWWTFFGLHWLLDRREDTLAVNTILGSILLLYGVIGLVGLLRSWPGWWPEEKEEPKEPAPTPPAAPKAPEEETPSGCVPIAAFFWLGGFVLVVFLRSRTGSYNRLLIGVVVVIGILAIAWGALRRRRRP